MKEERQNKHIKRDWYFIAAVFIISAVFRSICGIRLGETYIFYDELIHTKLAESLAESASLIFRGISREKGDILYYALIMPAFWFKNRVATRAVIVIINSLLMSSVVFPVYYLGTNLLKNIWGRYAVCILSAAWPEMCYTQQILQENLFYPLLVFYFAVFFQIEMTWQQGKKIKKRKFLLTGICSYLLYLTKDLGIIFIAATGMLWSITAITEKAERRGQRITALGLYFLGVIGMELMMSPVYHFLTADARLQLMGAEGLKQNLTAVETALAGILPYIGMGKELFHAIAVYLLLFVVLTGILPFFLVIAGFRTYGKAEKNLCCLFLLSFAMTVGAVCLLEMRSNQELRIHFRYLFEMTPVLLLFFFYVCENKILSYKVIMAAAVIYISLLSFISILPPWEYVCYDCISAKALYPFSSDSRYGLLQLGIAAVIFFGIVMIILKQWKVITVFVVVGLICTDMISSYHCYMDIYSLKIRNAGIVRDALRVNKYFEQKEGYCLLITEDGLSLAMLECYLDADYYLCTYEKLKEFQRLGEADIHHLPVLRVSDWYQQEDAHQIMALISEMELDIEGYRQSELGLEKYYMYEKIND